MPSELALREQLAAADGAALRILLTDRAEHELAADVLARLPKRRLPRVEPWVALLQLFQAQSVDPRVARERWMADALLNAPGHPGPQPPASSTPRPRGARSSSSAWGCPTGGRTSRASWPGRRAPIGFASSSRSRRRCAGR